MVKRWKTIYENGTTSSYGDCCIAVEGKIDDIKAGIRKYKELKQKDPEMFKQMDAVAKKNSEKRQSVLNNGNVADKLIDNWASNKKKNKILTV